MLSCSEKIVTNNEDDEKEQQIVGENEQGEEEEEGMSSDTDENKSGNHGWADAMNKILHTNKPKRKKTIVLSKAKKLCDVVKKPKKEVLPFELEADGQVKREVIEEDDKDSVNEQKRIKKQKDTLKIRVKPDILDKERERMLQKIATKGVVTLFNAVKNQQGAIETKLKESGPLERKREKVLQSVDKNSFLDVLMGGTKSIEVDKTIGTQVKKNDDDQEANGIWKVLRDDFVMNASMKNWDNDDDGTSSENDQVHSDEDSS